MLVCFDLDLDTSSSLTGIGKRNSTIELVCRLGKFLMVPKAVPNVRDAFQLCGVTCALSAVLINAFARALRTILECVHEGPPIP